MTCRRPDAPEVVTPRPNAEPVSTDEEPPTVTVRLPLRLTVDAVTAVVTIRFPNVGLLVVAMDCGRLKVTVPVGESAITWLAVPMIDVTPVLRAPADTIRPLESILR